MEMAPLIKAYDHAKANDHVCAAGEFANATKHTSSAEALRTLKLLEDHHRRIHELVKDAPLQPDTSDIEGGGGGRGGEGVVDDAVDDGSDDKQPGTADDDVNAQEHGAPSTGPTARRHQQPPQLSPSTSNVGAKPPALASSLAQKRMIPQRDLKSSIASNLASARGIRSKQRGHALAPSMSNENAPGNFDVPPRVTDHNVRSRSQQGAADAQGVSKEGGSSRISEETSKAADPAPADEGYSRFYTNFSSLLSRISAPLAFAGLPLISEESNQSEKEQSTPELSPTHSRRSSSSSSTHKLSRSYSSAAEPELSKIYSKATLRAIARDHPPQDSFYVVPTSGHTVSYANILTRAEKEKRRNEATASMHSQGNNDDDDDDFVDARETLAAVAAGHLPTTLPAGAKRRVGRAQNERELHNTIEELCLENKTLKDLIDNLSKRLHLFEASSQNSHQALAESMRLMRPGSPVSVGSGGGGGGGGGSSGGSSKPMGAGADDALRNRVQELEEQLALAMRDNEKKQKTLHKYREKWEVLKAGAKARREAQGMSTESTDD